MKLHLLTGVAALTLLSLPSVAVAQDEERVEDTVVVTGTRRASRSSADTPAPVDVFTREDLDRQGATDMSDLIRTIVPSYNVNAQPISDAATLVRPANLRGLSPDHTLVLINGKRRHRSAVISFLGGGLADGAQGPDLTVIPPLALERVEVLRDGAAAQYGSDAIAGVMNFMLRDDTEGMTFDAKYGSTYEGDGTMYQLGGHTGFALGTSGFGNLSFEYREVDPTSRSIQRTDAAALIAGGNTDVADPAQIWGSPQIHNDFKVFGNFGVTGDNGQEFYAFGNYAQREVEGGFFFRNPNTRPAVFSNDGGVTRLVGDLTPGSGTTCPTITIGAANEAALLAQVFADPECFVFNEIFPGGFTPRFGGNINDLAGVAGVRGEFDIGSGLMYDLSFGSGRSEVAYFINNTVNATLGPDTPTTFKPGTYIQIENNLNADFVYEIPMDGWASPLNAAFGFEWREEQFEIQAGDPESYTAGPLVDQGFSIGSNGFPGFSPSIAGSFDRSNYSAYLDFEADLTDRLTLGTAVRLESFDDFGQTTNYKIAGMWRASDSLSLRSTFSTGFHAPTPGQANVSNVSTVFEGGALINRGTIPPTSPIAALRGGSTLQPEESESFTFGAVFDLGPANITVDFYNIEVTDRIAQSASQTLTPAEVAQLVAAGVEGAQSLSTFRFFTNDFDTETQGFDVVATYPFDFLGGDSRLTATWNYTKTEVTDFNPTIINATRVRQLEENLPQHRGNVTWTHSQGDFRGLVRMNYYGSYWEAHLDDGTLPIDAGSEFTFDVEASWQLTDEFEWVIGADNVFDEYPDDNPWAGIVGAAYPVTSPMGFNGGFYYTRIRITR